MPDISSLSSSSGQLRPAATAANPSSTKSQGFAYLQKEAHAPWKLLQKHAPKSQCRQASQKSARPAQCMLSMLHRPMDQNAPCQSQASASCSFTTHSSACASHGASCRNGCFVLKRSASIPCVLWPAARVFLFFFCTSQLARLQLRFPPKECTGFLQCKATACGMLLGSAPEALRMQLNTHASVQNR